MSFLSILDTLLIGPLKLVFEVIFSIATQIIGHPGLAIIVLSLIMNILVLPLYRRADAMQEEARDVDLKLKDGVAHIKKTFSGDERMMILQTYYQQNNYSPLSALKGSVSLLLEIPFFMAAYQFLSNLSILDGVSLGPISDLGSPDGLIVLGPITLNLLPILMTLINVISSYLYLKGFPLKTKIQLYAMALFFLFFLYDSPSCLVFYWTLNNLFSLVKTIFYKIKNPKKVLEILTFVMGIGFIVFGIFFYGTPHIKRKLLVILIGVLLMCPLIFALASKHITFKKREPKPNSKMFLLGSIVLTVLFGILIPSTFIAASPQEYIDISYFHSPIWYIVSSACLSAGIFLVWMRVFYWLASPLGKEIFDKLVLILSGVALVNYMFFGTDLGVISAALKYEDGMFFTLLEQGVNLAVIVVLAAALYFIVTKFKRVVVPVLLTLSIALVGMSVPNFVTIQKSVSAVTAKLNSDSDETIHLSDSGKNVIVIMLDRALGQYIPYLFNESPELKKQFEGFTYYNNVVSHGWFTNTGAPSLLGGYEYTPVEMNKRDDELLVDKHNEALKVMPVAFKNEDFKVTVCDPVYAGYQWIPDVSIYDEYSDIRSFITEGKYTSKDSKQQFIDNNTRNFFCFSLMKGLPLFIQPTVYDDGNYNKADSNAEVELTYPQKEDGLNKATGVNSPFMNSYNTLTALPGITNVDKDSENTFLLLTNATTHEPQLLQMPDYVPMQNVDNTEYSGKYKDGITVDGVTLKMNEFLQVSHYQVNMAALKQMGNWFDHMRKNGVFDNTRIILASDHGRDMHQIDKLALGGEDTVEAFFPLLMVKDFNSKEFKTSSTFMTTADVPYLAMNGVIENPTNPFTNKPITMDEKTAHDQLISMSNDWDVAENNGEEFMPSRWASVKDNIWDVSNWKVSSEKTVLKEHKLP
ncbi:MAG: YidC/Oxa1 family membrane protein insertase [Oscillospiraceae bacterium]|nr:YidC/Oxa1 family membrane protein insertase [Oscillospiraceae bacterium]